MIFYSHFDSTGNKYFFSELKQLYKKENYLRLNNFETCRAISGPRLSLYKFATVVGIWYNIERQKKKLCSCGTIEREIYLLLDCTVYKDLRDSLFLGILETNEIDLIYGNRFEKLKILFTQWSLFKGVRYGFGINLG